MEEEYNRYWKTVVETMGDGLMIVDTDGLIVSVNQAMEELTGYTREELIGQSCAVLDCDLCFQSRAHGGDKYCGLFNQGQVRRRRCKVRRKDGTQRPMLKNAQVLKDDAGQVVGGVETLTDLSEVAAKDEVISRLRRQLSREDGLKGMLGTSPAMQQVYGLVQSAAHSEAPVILYGESGTGKELAVAAIHELGPRRQGPFVKVNIAALNESLLESELFGHVKGAFTGADRTRVGRFETASGGDIFLDEIGDLPLSTQVKLLRVLQEKVIEKVGAQEPVPVDARILTATNKNLNLLMAQGRFREDLYYRIAVIPIRLPPLRERREDIPLLIEDFIQRAGLKTEKAIAGMDRRALETLLAHDWPGNVRELINVVEYAFVLCPGGEIRLEHLPAYLTDRAGRPRPDAASRARRGRAVGRDEILEALRESGGNKAEAARRLGVSRVTLWKWLKARGITPEELES